MKNPQRVYVHVWTGNRDQARAIAAARFPGCDLVFLPHDEIRQGGWKEQIRRLRALRGAALVFYFDSIEDAQQLEMIWWTGLVHRCRETVVADGRNYYRAIRGIDWGWIWPRSLSCLIADIATFSLARIFLPRLRSSAPPANSAGHLSNSTGPRIAYLAPNPLKRPSVGGAMSHMRGVLSGMARIGSPCEVFSGCPLPIRGLDTHLIPSRQHLYVFWEAMLLRYNVQFARLVRKQLRKNPPAVFYQRHGRFIIAGALLARWTRIPLVLEYNGSEIWLSRNWDPGRFSRWLALCEEVSLANASLVVVVSEPLRQELIKRGIPEDRILVNPNGVDPEYFRPGAGDPATQSQLGIAPREILVTFVGTFGPWHGIEVLQQAIQALLADPASGAVNPPLRFLAVGSGTLHEKFQAALESEIRSGRVILTGSVPRDKVRDCLDASDILVSPHVRMADGSDFFGSPTKLFEYMAMGKAIVASRLDQIGEVLEDERTALLTEPGNPEELAAAIRRLALDAELRQRLGQNARLAAVSKHSWGENARILVERVKSLGISRETIASSSAPVRADSVANTRT
jgi:glycosyltransferase involved in cell wall biosynthesis